MKYKRQPAAQAAIRQTWGRRRFEGDATSGTTETTTTIAATSGTDTASREIESLRREAANWRTKLRAEEEAKKALEAQLAKAQADSGAALLAAQMRSDILLAAARAGFNDPQDALQFVSLSPEDTDEKKRGEAIKTALEGLKEAKPYLLRQAPSAPVPTGSKPVVGNPASAGTTLTAEDLKKMAPEDINRRWEEVQAVLTRE